MRAIVFETVRFIKEEDTDVGIKATITDVVGGSIVKITLGYSDEVIIGRVSKIEKRILQVDSSEKHHSEVYDIMFKDIESVELTQ